MALNGFDERYKPAYYEDTDFCFRVRYELGKQVVYQPLAEVIHFEGVSHGKKQSHGLKKYQELNRSKFIEKWGYILKDRLKKEHLPAADDLNYFPKLKKILIIDSRIPMPDKDSGSVRMFEIINILIGLKCHVTFLPDNLSINGLDADKLKFVGVKLVGGPYYSVRSYLKENASNYDYVLISKADVAKRNLNWALKYCRNSKLIFDTVDLHHLRERREGEIKSSKLRIMKSKRRYRDEISYVKRSDLTLVVSNEEKEYILKECPRSNVKVLSNIHDVKLDIPKFTDRNGILFIGGYEHPPNVDAVLFFANEIWPKIVEQRPDMVWFVVGSKMPESIKALKSNNISILGYLPDLSEILGRVRLTVAPLRYGAGVKGKVNTSMSFGVPSVISHVAAEGLHAIDGKDTLIADSPDEWVNKILRIYDDEDLWNRVSLNGKVNVSSHFSHERALAVLSEIVLQ